MNTNWEKQTIENIANLFNGKAIKPGGNSKYPIYGSNGIIGRTDKYKFNNAIIIGRVGAYCGSIEYCEDLFWASDNTIVLKEKDYNKTSIYFLYCLLKYLKLNRYAGGSAQPLLTQNVLKRISFKIPSYDLQEKIASILSAYDELIENNNRRIEILEKMAETIYKEWFVYFRFPEHEKVEMVDSELGKIPKGWEVKFKDYVDFLEGPGLRSRQYREKGIPFLNIRTLNNNEIDFTKVNFIDEKEVAEHYNHFLLLEDDHVVSSSGTIGRVVTIRKNHLPLLLNTSIIRMRPKNSRVGKWFLKHFLKSLYFQGQIRAYAIGSAQINYGPSHLKRMWLILPTENISRLYEDIVNPLEEQIKNILDRNIILKNTRDILLPKLISGTIDVSDLDIKIEEKK
jgi:type I restriction enzyme, S subunit